jgi:hypothetical protein
MSAREKDVEADRLRSRGIVAERGDRFEAKIRLAACPSG